MSDDPLRYVFDSFAILALLYKEEGASQVKEILKKAKIGEAKVFMHWNNLGEIYYIIRKENPQKRAIKAVSLIKSLPIELIEFDEEISILAAEFKGSLPISYGDAFVMATALHKDAAIVTGDPDFEKVKDRFKIEWLPHKERRV